MDVSNGDDLYGRLIQAKTKLGREALHGVKLDLDGVGLADEYPSLKHWVDWEAKGYDGRLEEGMTLCVESFIGVEGGKEGVKLEEQVLVTADGARLLSSYPMETDWL